MFSRQQQKNALSTPTTQKYRNVETPISRNNKSPKILQLIESKFAKQNEIIMSNIERCVKESVNSAVKGIEDKIAKISTNVNNLTERLNKLELSLPKLNEMEREIKTLKSKIERQNNLNVSTNLRLCGVPSEDNENLEYLFANLCNFLNIKQPYLKSIQRINNKTTKNRIDGVILLQFFSSQDRNFFLRTISKYKRETKSQLSLASLGFKSNAHIYINEDLTNNNYKIFREALKYKKQKQLSSAYTLRGLVYVKRIGFDRSVRMDDIEELNFFLSNNELSKKENDCQIQI